MNQQEYASYVIYEIESEEYVILRCPGYHDYRQQLFNHAFDVSNDFLNFNDCQKLCFILNTPTLYNISALTCFNILMSRRQEIYHDNTSWYNLILYSISVCTFLCFYSVSYLLMRGQSF